jgi:DNA polymerase I-like protein with 3'-5' exonuclease and polymerase domains
MDIQQRRHTKHVNILVCEIPDNYEANIRLQLSDRFSLDNVRFSVILISSLNYNDIEGYCIGHLQGLTLCDYWGIKGESVTRVEDCSDVSVIAECIASQYIEPIVNFCDQLDVAKRWLARYDSDFHTVAVDFEAKDLTLPQFNKLTMLSIGWNLLKSTVIVFKDQAIRDYVLNWLVTTNCRQIWHNSLFDLKFVHYYTKSLPKSVEDSQLLAAVYNNNVDSSKRISGLKALAGSLYQDWANDKSSFDLYDTTNNPTVTNLNYHGTNDPSVYNLALIKYAGIDTMATKLAWEKYDIEPAHPNHWIMPTSEPKHNTEGFNQRYYYEFILKPAIPVILEMIMNGQAIDLSKVDKLKSEVEAFNKETLEKISNYPLVKKFQDRVDQERIDKFLAPVYKSMKKPKYTGYKNNVAMRTWIVNYYDGTDFDKVTANDLKSMNTQIAKLLLDKQFDDLMVRAGADAYELAECARQNTNANRIDKIEHPEKYIQIGFNPWNYQQLKQMWLEFGLESDEVSKQTGEMSFSSDVLKELAETTTGDVQEIIKHYISVAESKNLITQYIPKLKGSYFEGRVYGSARLMGTISGRLSSKAPKISEPEAQHKVGIPLLTQPSSGSAFAKPFKRFFKAPPGKLVIEIDYSNLEGHISAILTKDETSVRNLKQNFDTHVLHSAAYWTDKWEAITGIPFDKTSLDNNKAYKKFCSTHPEAKQLRSDSKGITFGLAYGAYPPKVAKQAGCSLEEAEGIFNNFHNVLYPGVTAYREDYVLPRATEQGYLHMNWGLRLYSNNVKKDIRTLGNATMQSYSDLTLIAGVSFDKIIKEKQLTQRVKLINTIHDSLYYEVDNDPELIKWMNDTLPPIMGQKFVHNQAIDIKAEIDIGHNLYDTETIEHGASLERIKEILSELRN